MTTTPTSVWYKTGKIFKNLLSKTKFGYECTNYNSITCVFITANGIIMLFSQVLHKLPVTMSALKQVIDISLLHELV